MHHTGVYCSPYTKNKHVSMYGTYLRRTLLLLSMYCRRRYTCVYVCAKGPDEYTNLYSLQIFLCSKDV